MPYVGQSDPSGNYRWNGSDWEVSPSVDLGYGLGKSASQAAANMAAQTNVAQAYNPGQYGMDLGTAKATAPSAPAGSAVSAYAGPATSAATPYSSPTTINGKTATGTTPFTDAMVGEKVLPPVVDKIPKPSVPPGPGAPGPTSTNGFPGVAPPTGFPGDANTPISAQPISGSRPFMVNMTRTGQADNKDRYNAPSGNYAQWLANLDAYAPSDPSSDMGTATQQFDAMMKATSGDTMLSPFYRQLLQANLNKAQAGYDMSAALGGTDMPKNADGSTLSFGQYMRNQLGSIGRSGNGASGWGNYDSGMPYYGALLDILKAGGSNQGWQGGINGSPALDSTQTQDVLRRFNTDSAARQHLAQLLGAGIEGPYASLRRKQLDDIVTNPAASGLGTDVFLRELQDWARQAYGRGAGATPGAGGPVAQYRL